MASSNTDSPGTIYRWIERKPLTEAVSWTSKEKFWLTIAMCHYGTHDWKSVAQVLRHGGEPYRPREWFTPKSCERQFKILVSNLSKEAKLLPFLEMMQHIAEGLKSDYVREVNKSRDTLKLKYCNLFSILNRVKQGNLSRNEVVSLYSQARRNEIEGKQYMDQLMTRQNASLASENSNSGLIEEPIKWNTPSAPLLTSLLRSRNTIPANRTATTITSLLQSPGGTSRTRSGKLLTLTPSSRTSQGTPTLSKLLEAPANPYIPSPPQTTQKNKLSVAVVTEKLANTSRKENSQSISLNKVRVDNMTTLGSFNQINKSNLSASKKQISKSPVSAVKNGSKANLNVVNLLSDSENEEDKNTCLKSSFGDKKDTTSRVEPRATRSQTRAEGGFKQFNDTKLSDGKKERENLRQQSGGSQIIETHLIDDDMADIDQIEVEPLSSIQDEIQTQTSSKIIGSSLQKPSLSSAEDNLSTNNKVNISKETSNEISEETSISLILTPKNKNFIPDHHCLIGNPLDEILSSESSIDAKNSSVQTVVRLRKDSMSLPNTLTTSDEKLLKQKGVIELKATNIRCVDNRSDSKMSYNNQPIVVVNKIKKPFNIKLTSEQRVEDIQVANADVKKPMTLNNSSQNVVEVIENNSTVTATDDDDDAVIIVEDNININDNNKTTMKTNELSSNIESQNLSSIVVSPNISCNSVLQLDGKKNKNDKTPWNVFGKPQNILDSTKKQCHQGSVAKDRINSNISETNNKCIKELDFDFDQSISQTSLAELYNGVEEIVEMHSFDNEELNSLIECGSLDSNETEEHRNTVSVDQGDSSVSESDSTIGAFDTFAQITRVRQKSSNSKEIKLDNRELKTTNQGIRHLKESFCQSNKIEDDQSSPVSVTGIPVLQGVISDVMNQIDLNSVASLATSTSHIPPSNDVVEILSSDDEMNVKNFKARPLNEQNKPIGTQDKEKEEKSSTFKEAELVKLPEVESKMYKSNNTNCKISTIEPIDIEMPPCIVVKSHISVADRMQFDKILAIKTEIYQNETEYDTIHDTIPDEIIVVNDEEEVQPLAVKSAKERLIKETERMKREAEEKKKKEEERKRKEDDERKKKEEDERKKKENDDRMKRENEERMKKEEELKKKELENILLNERKKKEDEDRKIKEDEERKKKEDEEKKIKEDEEKKIKALHETMRKEKEQQILQKIDEEERQKNITKEKLNEFHLRMKNDMNDMKDISLTLDKIVVVKEEIIDECVDDILEEIIDKDELEEDMILNDEYLDDIIGRINMSTISQKSRAMKNIFKRRSELAQIRDYELRWKEESIKSRIKLKECMQIQDLLNKREKLKLSAGDVSAQKRYTRIKPQTMINILEYQNREAKEVDNQRYKEIDVKKIMEAERQRAYEIISKEAEMKRVKTAELERIKNEKIKKAEEVETKKSKEVELRKNIIVKETEIKGLEKRSVLKKMNEPENKRSVGHTEINLIKNYAIILPDIMKQCKPIWNSSVSLKKFNETKKATAKEDFETSNLREKGIKKSVGSEGKKVIESKLPEIKMVTRTRGLKAEEKLKETNVSKSMSTKPRPQIKPSGSTSSISSSTIAENLSISSYENKKQTKNVDDGNKRNSSSNIPHDNRHFRDLNVDSSDIVRKENSNHEAIGTPRTRTRSLTFSEIKSSKQSQDNETSIVLKESSETKAIFTAAHHFSNRHFLNKHLFNDDYDSQTLIPVVMLDKNEISLKAAQKSMSYILKQNQNTSTHNQVQKPIETIKQLEKPPPKKRGRKRRIDVQNEKLQESIRSNKLTPKNFRKTRTSIKEVEPLAKRTRRSLGLLNTKKESVNKRQSVHSRKFKKEFVDKSVENIKTNKKVLKFVFNNLCERSKYILSLNKETKNLPPKCLDILKFPIELQKIKRKITAGKITSIAELQFNLLILSHNVLMTKRSDSKVFSDASNFQFELEEYFRSLKNIVADQNVRKCQNDSFYIHNNCYNKRRYPGSNYDPSDAHITINKKTIANIYKYIDNSSDESSGSESDSYMPPKKKRKKNVSDSSSSESD